MVDVGEKPVSRRSAVASASVRMQLATFERLAAGDAPKGDVLAAARIAGILGAKRTPELIPLCHPVATTRVSVEIALDATLPGVRARVLAEAEDRTGVEMEAMVGASLAALTVYDMLKGIDRAMRIEQVRLEMKQGGRSGRWEREGGG
jgi:cyclic pyranopterin phosphate synthase